MAKNERTIKGKQAIPPHLLKNIYSIYNASDVVIIDSPDDSKVYQCTMETLVSLISACTEVQSGDYTEDDAAASITISANHYIERVIVKPHATKTVTGLQIGTTVGAEDVVAATDIILDASQDPVSIMPNEEMFSFSSSQTLWVSATDWNPVTQLTIYVVCRRIA